MVSSKSVALLQASMGSPRLLSSLDLRSDFPSPRFSVSAGCRRARNHSNMQECHNYPQQKSELVHQTTGWEPPPRRTLELATEQHFLSSKEKREARKLRRFYCDDGISNSAASAAPRRSFECPPRSSSSGGSVDHGWTSTRTSFRVGGSRSGLVQVECRSRD